MLLAGFATLVILRNVLGRVVRVDDVLGAVCGYLLTSRSMVQSVKLIEMFSRSFSVGSRFGASLTPGTGGSPYNTSASAGTSVGSGACRSAPRIRQLLKRFGQFYIRS